MCSAIYQTWLTDHHLHLSHPCYTTCGTPAPSVQLPAPPTPPIVPPAQPIQPAPMPQLNWSHFKPEFAGKPDKDVEPHLLRTNDWMNIHAFQKVLKFCNFV